ncbi:prepilin-type N-terminal cleavage/methylation domain-containing protein [Azohydromonas lata]|uniref:prepilin-type N-terminal cleavage/methylation domain-containing protein n=1 Tax=Azohydromonas lata TaxID=45677 RepID=UPI000829F67B|nr:prepilin-type N-terminal cleavage/methylation domain-containing protein [Azohydromonas lata]
MAPVPSSARPRLRRHARPPRQHGFTLVELILSAGLLSLLAVTATFFWVNGWELARRVNADSAALDEGRAALERLAREIRELKYDRASAAYCVSTMTATQMVFNKTSGGYVSACGGASPASANGDIAVTIQWPANGTSLSLRYAGSLASPAATRTLTGYASAFSMRYLDAALATTTSAAALRFVELSLTVQPPGLQATQTRTLVAVRNN